MPLIFLYPYRGVFAAAAQTQEDEGWFSSKTHQKLTQIHDMSAADLPKHLCYDGYLTSDSDLSVIIWPLSIWGKAQGKDHSFGLCMDH